MQEWYWWYLGSLVQEIKFQLLLLSYYLLHFIAKLFYEHVPLNATV